MSTPIQPAGPLSSGRWQDREALLDRFEDAWGRGERPAIADYWSAEADAVSLLAELVQIDLELRLKVGEPARVEEYLRQHPQLAAEASAVIELAVAEFRLRRRREASLSVNEYLGRFPQHQAELAQRLPEIAAEAPVLTTPPSGVAGLGADSLERTEAGKPPHDDEALAFLAPPQAEDELGRLGDFRILTILGRGGMGVVFQGEDPKLGRRVAIKAMLPHLAPSKSAQQRFLREARAAAALEHDHIVPIYHVGEERGTPFIVMPFLKGTPLDRLVPRDQKLPLADVLRIGREIAAGLAAAHAAGLIHRDIKPANIWLEDTSGSGVSANRGRVKILDFGLARASAAPGLTEEGAIVGTPAFMAPEQARGEPLDARCDLWSLGIVLYQLCTGQLPFRGTDGVSTLLAVATEEPPPPRQVNPDVPQPLNDLIVQLLAKDRGGRPGSAAEVVRRLAELEQSFGLTQQLSPQDWPRPTPPRKSRSGRWVALAALVLLVSGVALVLGGYFARPPGKGSSAVDTGKAEEPAKPSNLVGNPLDRLDAAKVPGEEREPGQPKELVAVLGSRHMHHWGNVLYLEFTPNGKLLFSRGPSTAERLVRFWDTASLRELGTIPLGQVAPKVSKDGKTLALRNLAGLLFWDISGDVPRNPRQLPWPGATNYKLAELSPDFSALAVVLKDNSVLLRDVEADAPDKRRSLPAKNLDNIKHLQFSTDGKKLAVFTPSGVSLWDISRAEPRELPTLMVSEPISLSADFSTLLSQVTGARKCWDVSGAQPRELCQFGALAGMRPAFTPDGKKLVDTAYGTFTIRDLAGKVLFKDRMGSASQHTSLFAFSPDGKMMAMGVGNSIQFWDWSGPVPQRRTELSDSPVQQALFTPDGRYLLARDSLTTKLWDLGSVPPRVQTVLQGPLAGQNAAEGPVALSADGKVLASTHKSSNPAMIRFWDLAGGEATLRCEVKGLTGPIAWAHPGRTLAVGLEKPDGMVGLWDVSGDKPVEKPAFQAQTKALTGLASSADGRVLACFSAEAATVQLWDMSESPPRKGLLVAMPPNVKLLSIVLSADGKTLGTHVGAGAYEGWLWDISGLEPRRQGKVQTEPFHPLYWAFAPDGKKLASYTTGNLSVWDSATGALLSRISSPGPVERFTFAADSRHLAVSNANGTVYILRLSDERLEPRKE